MNHRNERDPRSPHSRGREAWDERQGRHDEDDRAGRYDGPGFHGGGTRTFEGGGYAGGPQWREDPRGPDPRARPVHGHARDERGAHGGMPASSTYGGLGHEGPYGTHGWSRQGDGYDLDDRQFDADYRQWREQQMRQFDRDYEQWRQERYRQFSEEFDRWRATRQAGAPAQPPAGQGEPDAGTASPGGASATQTPKTG